MHLFPISPDMDTRFKMLAKTIYGLEEITAAELSRLGAEKIECLNRAVAFEGNIGVMYKANYLLRTALRVLVPIFELEVTHEDDLYLQVKSIPWESWMDLDQTLAIDTVLNTDLFTHSQYISQKVKDAIADRFREKTGARPSVELDRPDIRINVHIAHQKVTLSLDSSGDSLHRRGYREKTNLAPINEVLAAGLIQLSGWDQRSTLLDPMCGSGTILIEAAMLAAKIPSGYFREWFGLMQWKKVLAFDEALWENITNAAIERISSDSVQLYGIELSEHVARKAKENIKRSQTADMIRIANRDFLEADPPPVYGKPVLIMNPPYGERMDKDDIIGLYQAIGDKFKKSYSGWDCWIISSNLEALKFVGLRPSRKIMVYNGQLECRFMKFGMYAGKKYGATEENGKI